MMNLSPYRRDNSIFNLMDSFEKSFFNDSIGGFSQFRTDISETDGAYNLEAELPGFDPQDIKVNVDGDTMTISAESNQSSDEKDEQGNYIRRERRWGSFSRSFDVSGIDADGITANYNNGVLKVELPKAAEQKPETRQIAVNSGDSNKQMGEGQPAQNQQYSGPAAEQAKEVQQNNQPEEYVGGDKSDQPQQ